MDAAQLRIANRSEAVEVNGVRLYGLDAEVYLKLQAKRDPEQEKQLGEWVAQCTEIPLEFPDDVVESLRSGIQLCTLANKIQPGIISKFNTRRIPLLEMENIGLYLKACWELGVPSSDLFVTSDLYLRKAENQVFQNLQSLARIAQTHRSFKGPRIGPRQAERQTTKWTGMIKERPAVFISDIEESERRQREVAQEREMAGIEREAVEGRRSGEDMAKLWMGKFEEEIKVRKTIEKELADVRAALDEAIKRGEIAEEMLRKEKEKGEEGGEERAKLAKEVESAQKALNRRTGMRSQFGLAGINRAIEEESGGKGIGSYLEVEDRLKEAERRAREEEERRKKVQEKKRRIKKEWKREVEKGSRLAIEKEQSKEALEREVKQMRDLLSSQQQILRRGTASGTSSPSMGESKPATAASSDELEMENRVLMEQFERMSKELEQAREKLKKKDEEIEELKDEVEISKEREKELIAQVEQERLRSIGNTQRSPTQSPSLSHSTSPQVYLRGDRKLLQSLQGKSTGSTLRVRSLAWRDPASPRGMDDTMVETLNRCVTKVMYSSSNVEFHHIVQLNQAFELDYGRRQFAFVLKQLIHRIPSLCLSTYAFDMMLYLMHRALHAMDQCPTKKDFISAGILKSAAARLYRDDDGVFLYIKDFVKDFSIWKDTAFWEESFNDELIKKLQGGEKDEDPESNDEVIELLDSFVNDMLEWSVPQKNINSFIETIGDQYKVDRTTQFRFLKIVASYVPSKGEKKINSEKLPEEPLSPRIDNSSPGEPTSPLAKQQLATRSIKKKRIIKGKGKEKEADAEDTPENEKRGGGIAKDPGKKKDDEDRSRAWSRSVIPGGGNERGGGVGGGVSRISMRRGDLGH